VRLGVGALAQFVRGLVGVQWQPITSLGGEEPKGVAATTVTVEGARCHGHPLRERPFCVVCGWWVSAGATAGARTAMAAPRWWA
jgi:hypothetical protein